MTTTTRVLLGCLAIVFTIGLTYAMVEEIRMTRTAGDAYRDFRDRTPFLMPLPSWLSSVIAAPMRLAIRRSRPETGRAVFDIVPAAPLRMNGTLNNV